MSNQISPSGRLRATISASLHDQFCALGVERGLLTEEQVAVAPRDGSFQPALVDDGTLTTEQLRALQRAAAYRVGRDEDKALGNLMVGHGYVEDHVIRAALELQRSTFESSDRLVRLAELMVRSGTLSPGHVIALRKLRALTLAH